MSLFKKMEIEIEDPCAKCEGKDCDCSRCEGCENCFMWENEDRNPSTNYACDAESNENEGKCGNAVELNVLSCSENRFKNACTAFVMGFLGGIIAIKLCGGK